MVQRECGGLVWCVEVWGLECGGVGCVGCGRKGCIGMKVEGV